MQISDRAVAAHQKPAPDHGTDLVNPNMQAVNLGTGFVGHHCLSVANNHQNCEPITPAPVLNHSPSSYNLASTTIVFNVIANVGLQCGAFFMGRVSPFGGEASWVMGSWRGERTATATASTSGY